MGAPRYVSPLRYPGGKARMAAWLDGVFNAQLGFMDIEVWIEPFAGGAGAGLTLLEREAVGEVWLVERNPALAAFWRCVALQPEALADRVRAMVPTVAGWEEAREVVAAAWAGEAAGDDLAVGLAAFLVNRCSRSGMVAPRAGVMGGRRQDGDYSISSRFNADSLADRILAIGEHAHRLRVYEGDGISYIEDLADCGFADEVVVFADPPYIGVGNRLYQAGLPLAEHHRLAAALRGCPARWLLTYDAHPQVLASYDGFRVARYTLPHQNHTRKIGHEYLVLSDNLWLPTDDPVAAGSELAWVA